MRENQNAVSLNAELGIRKVCVVHIINTDNNNSYKLMDPTGQYPCVPFDDGAKSEVSVPLHKRNSGSYTQVLLKHSCTEWSETETPILTWKKALGRNENQYQIRKDSTCHSELDEELWKERVGGGRNCQDCRWYVEARLHGTKEAKGQAICEHCLFGTAYRADLPPVYECCRYVGIVSQKLGGFQESIESKRRGVGSIRATYCKKYRLVTPAGPTLRGNTLPMTD